MRFSNRSLSVVALCAFSSVLALSGVAGNEENAPTPNALIAELQNSTRTLQEVELDLRASNQNDGALEHALGKIDGYRLEAADKLRHPTASQDPKVVTSEYCKRSFAVLYDDTDRTRYVVMREFAQGRRALALLRKTDNSGTVADEYAVLLKTLAQNLFDFEIDLSIPQNAELLLAKGFLFGSTPEDAGYAFQKTVNSF